MVRHIKEGAILIDLNASQGGCFETSRLTDLHNPFSANTGSSIIAFPISLLWWPAPLPSP